jgi:hypothetical protein
MERENPASEFADGTDSLVAGVKVFQSMEYLMEFERLGHSR